MLSFLNFILLFLIILMTKERIGWLIVGLLFAVAIAYLAITLAAQNKTQNQTDSVSDETKEIAATDEIAFGIAYKKPDGWIAQVDRKDSNIIRILPFADAYDDRQILFIRIETENPMLDEAVKYLYAINSDVVNEKQVSVSATEAVYFELINSKGENRNLVLRTDDKTIVLITSAYLENTSIFDDLINSLSLESEDDPAQNTVLEQATGESAGLEDGNEQGTPDGFVRYVATEDSLEFSYPKDWSFEFDQNKSYSYARMYLVKNENIEFSVFPGGEYDIGLPFNEYKTSKITVSGKPAILNETINENGSYFSYVVFEDKPINGFRIMIKIEKYNPELLAIVMDILNSVKFED
ncbi:TPA: hypothetical protein DCZ32_01605 [Candidatus Uhrbacteria bacterium]|nr:hypothetical protein [Candidatus Uhrbacteria bacterium]